VGIRSDVLVEELSPVNSKRPQLASELRVGGVEASHPSDGLFEVFYIGGRVTVLQTTLPNVGPGALKYRDVSLSSVKKVS